MYFEYLLARCSRSLTQHPSRMKRRENILAQGVLRWWCYDGDGGFLADHRLGARQGIPIKYSKLYQHPLSELKLEVGAESALGVLKRPGCVG